MDVNLSDLIRHNMSDAVKRAMWLIDDSQGRRRGRERHVAIDVRTGKLHITDTLHHYAFCVYSVRSDGRDRYYDDMTIDRYDGRDLWDLIEYVEFHACIYGGRLNSVSEQLRLDYGIVVDDARRYYNRHGRQAMKSYFARYMDVDEYFHKVVLPRGRARRAGFGVWYRRKRDETREYMMKQYLHHKDFYDAYVAVQDAIKRADGIVVTIPD